VTQQATQATQMVPTHPWRSVAAHAAIVAQRQEVARLHQAWWDTFVRVQAMPTETRLVVSRPTYNHWQAAKAVLEAMGEQDYLAYCGYIYAVVDYPGTRGAHAEVAY